MDNQIKKFILIGQNSEHQRRWKYKKKAKSMTFSKILKLPEGPRVYTTHQEHREKSKRNKEKEPNFSILKASHAQRPLSVHTESQKAEQLT